MKLKDIFTFTILLGGLFNNSCSNKTQNNLSIFKALKSSLENSNNSISHESLLSEKSLEAKLADPQTAQKALYWFPRAMAVKTYTSQLIKVIDSIRNRFIQLSSFKNQNGDIALDEENMVIVSNYFVTENNGQKLRQILFDYYQNILKVDREMTSVFKENIDLEIGLLNPEQITKKRFDETFFKNTPAIAALAILEKFKNDVKIIESKLIAFCDNKIPHIDHSYFKI